MTEDIAPFLETKDDKFQLFERLEVTIVNSKGRFMSYKGILEIIDVPNNKIVLYTKFVKHNHDVIDLDKVILITRLPKLYTSKELREKCEQELAEQLKEESRINNRKYKREYYKKNKARVGEYVKNYHQKNKALIKEYYKKYYQRPKVREKLIQRSREYYKNHRDLILAKAKIRHKLKKIIVVKKEKHI